MFRVLIIDDSPSIRKLFELALGETFVLTFATTIPTAREHTATAATSFDAMVIAGQLGPAYPKSTTLSLIRDIRSSGFSGPMIAVSTDDELREAQLMAGCTFEHNKGDPIELGGVIIAALRKTLQ